MEGIIINLYGRVQGVNFRNMIKGFCDSNGIKGFVVNKEDGSVFVEAQGQKEKLTEFLKWVQGNPGLVHLSGMDYKWKKSSVNYKEFTISREGNYIVDKAKSILNLGRSIAGQERLKVPVHIALIPDGNRRWAKEKGLVGSFGHYKAGSYDNLEELFSEAKNLGVRFMSIWGFSTENWKRDKKEVDAIFSIVLDGIRKFRKNAAKNKIRFRHLGRKDRLPEVLRDEIIKLEDETKGYDDFHVQLCLDYGGKDEIVRAVNKILEQKDEIGSVDEESFSKHLDTNGTPEVDFVIRTSGEKRTSGFMPYQSSYAELYFSDVYFPDFDASELRRAVSEFSKRKRRFGGN